MDETRRKLRANDVRVLADDAARKAGGFDPIKYDNGF
jgi:hypothetical protein